MSKFAVYMRNGFSMKIVHTADLHLGQVIYQNYDRVDEHDAFFMQLEQCCKEESPDALVVSGDIFDIQQPSAAARKYFTEKFVGLHGHCPGMSIIITAGNHDSASRLQADSAVWKLADVHVIGIPPASDAAMDDDGWQDDYIIRLDSGYVIALPFMTGERRDAVQSILDKVAAENSEGKPVVMTGHLAVTGLDVTGHDFEIGKLRTQDACSLGTGYDYLALGHIHKPQTIGHQEDCFLDNATYPSGVIRYSGSALHVSCDEAYPHSISIVTIGRHGGDVTIRQRRIAELRHFYELPEDGGSFGSTDEALAAVRTFAAEGRSGYIRLRMAYTAATPPDFNQRIYDILEPYGDIVRFNPKHIWTGVPEKGPEQKQAVFQVAELQQMTDPMKFIERTKEQYPGLDIEEVRNAFEEVKAEMRRMSEEEQQKSRAKASKKNSAVITGNKE